MIRRRVQAQEHDDVPEYWITYSDLMVSLLMTFALMLFLALGSVQQATKDVRLIVDANAEAIRRAGDALRGAGQEVTLDTASGRLLLSEGVLFGSGSTILKSEARAAIRRAATGFLPRLLKEQSSDAPLQEIAIEGHTDTIGTYMDNMRLSQARAYAVMEAIFEATDTLPEAQQIRGVIVASGKSEMHPIRTGGRIDDARSRRIEIHIRFRNEALLRKVLKSAEPQR
jgi:chemotaxis protein MotB